MKFIKIIILTAMIMFSSQEIFSQCETWHGLVDSENLMNSFVIYRGFLKSGENEKAFQLWEVVYEKSPAADGKRSTVYSDGTKLYTEKFNAEKKKKRIRRHYLQVDGRTKEVLSRQ